ncbi:unnamed protein product [Closterium sp. NIES-54]
MEDDDFEDLYGDVGAASVPASAAAAPASVRLAYEYGLGGDDDLEDADDEALLYGSSLAAAPAPAIPVPAKSEPVDQIAPPSSTTTLPTPEPLKPIAIAPSSPPPPAASAPNGREAVHATPVAAAIPTPLTSSPVSPAATCPSNAGEAYDADGGAAPGASSTPSGRDGSQERGRGEEEQEEDDEDAFYNQLYGGAKDRADEQAMEERGSSPSGGKAGGIGGENRADEGERAALGADADGPTSNSHDRFASAAADAAAVSNVPVVGDVERHDEKEKFLGGMKAEGEEDAEMGEAEEGRKDAGARAEGGVAAKSAGGGGAGGEEEEEEDEESEDDDDDDLIIVANDPVPPVGEWDEGMGEEGMYGMGAGGEYGGMPGGAGGGQGEEGAEGGEGEGGGGAGGPGTPAVQGGGGAGRGCRVTPPSKVLLLSVSALPALLALLHLSPVTCHLSPVTCHLSPVTCHLSPVTCHLSPVTCHLSPVTCHLSPDTCHLSPVT